MSNTAFDDYFVVGYLNKTHGLNGELQLIINFDGLVGIENLDTFFLPVDKRLIPYSISSLKFPKPGLAYVCFEDIASIDQAQKLIRREVYLPITQKPLVRKQFSWLDVETFVVVDAHYGHLGAITRVQAMPQQFVAFLNYQNKEVLFPLHPDFIQKVDMAKKQLHTQLPQGLLEVYL